MRVSLIVPCYNEEPSLPILKDALHKVCAGRSEHEYEFIMVDDGSRDKTLSLLETWAAEDPRVH